MIPIRQENLDENQRRQRQRVFQMGLITCLLLLFLDARSQRETYDAYQNEKLAAEQKEKEETEAITNNIFSNGIMNSNYNGMIMKNSNSSSSLSNLSKIFYANSSKETQLLSNYLSIIEEKEILLNNQLKEEEEEEMVDEKDKENINNKYHDRYPYNATGFYRGQWDFLDWPDELKENITIPVDDNIIIDNGKSKKGKSSSSLSSSSSSSTTSTTIATTTIATKELMKNSPLKFKTKSTGRFDMQLYMSNMKISKQFNFHGIKFIHGFIKIFDGKTISTNDYITAVIGVYFQNNGKIIMRSTINPTYEGFNNNNGDSENFFLVVEVPDDFDDKDNIENVNKKSKKKKNTDNDNDNDIEKNGIEEEEKETDDDLDDDDDDDDFDDDRTRTENERVKIEDEKLAEEEEEEEEEEEKKNENNRRKNRKRFLLSTNGTNVELIKDISDDNFLSFIDKKVNNAINMNNNNSNRVIENDNYIEHNGVQIRFLTDKDDIRLAAIIEKQPLVKTKDNKKSPIYKAVKKKKSGKIIEEGNIIQKREEDSSKLQIPLPEWPRNHPVSIPSTTSSMKRKCVFQMNLYTEHVQSKKSKDDSNNDDDDDNDDTEGKNLDDDIAVRIREQKILEKQMIDILNGTVTSMNCGINMNVSTTAIRLNWDKAYKKAVNYSVITTLICITQIGLLFRQLFFSRTQAAAARVSIMCIGQQAIIDAILCISHLLLCAMIQPLFAAFAAIAFFKLIIFSIFEIRYMFVIHHGRNPQNVGGFRDLRRQLAKLHARFYAVLFAFLFSIYLFIDYVDWIIVALYSFWCPQIVFNAVKGIRQPMNRSYIVGMSITRLIIPIYAFGCPSNFIRVLYSSYQPNYGLCFILIFWMAAQVGMLISQEKWGPQYMIPARFLPPKYNYYRALPRSIIEAHRDQEAGIEMTSQGGNDVESGGLPECVICYNGIEISGANYMIAPCDHIFHKECLERWMDIKMECPVCRAALPLND